MNATLVRSIKISNSMCTIVHTTKSKILLPKCRLAIFWLQLTLTLTRTLTLSFDFALYSQLRFSFFFSVSVVLLLNPFPSFDGSHIIAACHPFAFAHGMGGYESVL